LGVMEKNKLKGNQINMASENEIVKYTNDVSEGKSRESELIC
jgi:hypothetical protein